MSKSRIRILVINLIIIGAVGGAGFWGWSALHPKAAPAQIVSTTATIGDVTSTISSSGTIISPGDVGVSPTTSGTIKTINVAVGQHVHTGELLATLDSTSLANALAQAKTNLATQQVQFAQDQQAITNAQQTLSQDQDLANANASTYQSAVDEAKAAVTNAQANFALDQTTESNTIQAAQSTYNTWFNSWNYYGFSIPFCQQLQLGSLGAATQTDEYSKCTTLINDYQAVVNAQNSATSLLTKDQQNIASLQAAYQDALTTQSTSLKKDQQTIVAAQNSLQAAQSALQLFKAQNGINSDNPTANDFSAAQAALTLAQQNYDGAFVYSPVTGDIATITGSVGSEASTASSSTIGSVSGMFVITNVSSLEVQAGFSESDAAKLKVGQPVQLSFDALTGVNATGKVLSIDLLPTTSSGATTYNAEFTIDGSVPGLKPGMTATVTVLVGSANNVLSLPSQAVNIRNSGAFVTVVTVKNGQQIQTRTPVVIGLQGDSADQIISGITAGTKVVLRTISTGSTAGFPASGVPSVVSGGGLGGGGGFGGGTGRAGG